MSELRSSSPRLLVRILIYRNFLGEDNDDDVDDVDDVDNDNARQLFFLTFHFFRLIHI